MITEKNYFNIDSMSPLDDKLYKQSNETPPSGFIDFNRCRYKWAKSLYDTSLNRFWTPQQVNVSNEKKNVANLTEGERAVYTRIFSQLSFDDSIQTFYLTDLSTKTNNTIVRGLMIKQAEVELLHSNSYAFLLDSVGNSDEVFDMYMTDDAIRSKNHAIAEMFARHINGNTMEDFLMSSMASVALEGIFFLTGFTYIFAMGDKVGGSSDMLKEIAIDEITIHLPMFANVVNTVFRENNGEAKLKDKMRKLLYEAAMIEMKFARELAQYGVMGITVDIMNTTIQNFVNDRCKILNLEPVFEVKPETHLQKLLKDRINNRNDTKGNFFEANVANYSIGSIDLDDF
jgi:ribonucleoside-diphosphate reductase beta chain